MNLAQVGYEGGFCVQYTNILRRNLSERPQRRYLTSHRSSIRRDLAVEIKDQVFLFHSLEDRVVDFIGFDSTIRISRDASWVRLDAWKAASYRKCTNGTPAATNRRSQPSLPS